MQTPAPYEASSNALAYCVITLLILMLILQQLVQPLPWLHLPLMDIHGLLSRHFDLATFAYNPQSPLHAPWRWLTTHLVHLDWPHALTNMVAFIAASVVFAPLLSARRLLAILITGALAACAVHTLNSVNVSFVGFSALTHAIVAYSAVLISVAKPSLCKGRQPMSRWIGYLMLLAIALKTALELTAPAGSLNWLGASAAVYAHLGGLLAGAAVALYLVYRARQ